MSSRHLFLSYSREDNKAPVNAAGEGWVTAFVGDLQRRHAAYSGRELRIFFDRQSIIEGDSLPRYFAGIDRLLDDRTTKFEQQVGQSADAALRAQHPRLRDQLDHLIRFRPPTRSLFASAGVAATFEGQHGSPARALDFTARILAAQEAILAANPESAQAARDVMVSHFKFFDFHRQRGDERAAIESLTKCFALLDAFARAGRPMDAQMRNLHAQLKPMFSQP